jgi:tRNA-dihydrouridine synthase B
VKEPEDAMRVLRQSGCDGIMLGRGAWGRPWLFREIDEMQKHGRAITPAPDSLERLAVLREHFELLLESFNITHACQVVRRYATWYIRDVKGSPAIRARMNRVNTREEFHEILDETEALFEQELGQTPSEAALATSGVGR